jgi:hypothetical protein
MPYPPGQREEIKNKIVQSARKLFNRFGFDGVSVDQTMADAGLTRGGFYSYFESKSDLYAEALACFFTDPNWKSRWEGIDVDWNAAENQSFFSGFSKEIKESFSLDERGQFAL